MFAFVVFKFNAIEFSVPQQLPFELPNAPVAAAPAVESSYSQYTAPSASANEDASSSSVAVSSGSGSSSILSAYPSLIRLNNDAEGGVSVCFSQKQFPEYF